MSKIYDVVVFHYPCQDGLASAWIVNKYHKEHNKDIELYPIQHGTMIDYERLRNKKVIFCDYSPKLEMLDKIESIVSEMCILDHHISAMKILGCKYYAIFDMNRSGAGITWDYFYNTEDKPLVIKCVEDRDLWKWKIEESRDLTSGLYLYCSTKELNDFTELFKIFDNIDYNEIIKIGNIYGKSLLNKANEIASENSIKSIKYLGYNICIVNCMADLSSDVGNILTSKYNFDFAVMWYYSNPKEEYRVSLRANNDVDVSEIAKYFGGGGHKNAGGFITKINPNELFKE